MTNVGSAHRTLHNTQWWLLWQWRHLANVQLLPWQFPEDCSFGMYWTIQSVCTGRTSHSTRHCTLFSLLLLVLEEGYGSYTTPFVFATTARQVTMDAMAKSMGMQLSITRQELHMLVKRRSYGVDLKAFLSGWKSVRWPWSACHCHGTYHRTCMHSLSWRYVGKAR